MFYADTLDRHTSSEAIIWAACQSKVGCLPAALLSQYDFFPMCLTPPSSRDLGCQAYYDTTLKMTWLADETGAASTFREPRYHVHPLALNRGVERLKDRGGAFLSTPHEAFAQRRRPGAMAEAQGSRI